MEKGVLYAPDFLINAGGLINVYREVTGNSEARAMELTENIYHTTTDIFNRSSAEGLTPQEAAMGIAKDRIEAIAKIKSVL